MDLESQKIEVNLPNGQNTLVLLQGEAAKQLDVKAPEKIDITGTIFAPFNWLDKRAKDIDQHKAHIIVNRDKLEILLVFNEDDPYKQGKVDGKVEFSEIFKKLHINDFSKGWLPETLGQFLKLNRSYFVSREENMKVVSALKSFDIKSSQNTARTMNERGNRSAKFQQTVKDSNIPESFKLKIPIFSGGKYEEIIVETFVAIDGADVLVHLQSAGANDVVEDAKANIIDDVLNQIRDIAPDIAIIEQ